METVMDKIGVEKYPAYKESGVEWLGVIPNHWEALSNKFIFRLKKTQVGKKANKYVLLSLTLNGIIKRDMENPQGKFPAEFDTYQEVKEGNFVFCLFDVEETPRAVGLSPFDGMITGAYSVMEPEEGFDKKFLYYFYLNLDADKRMKPLYKGLRNVIPKEAFFTFKTFVPPIEEQTAIANFLECKTIQIDKAIAQKERLIELLKERRQILIHKAVTRGLDPNVKMKDSGVEWIGEIPEHWEAKRLKSILQDGKNGIRIGPFGSAIKSEILKSLGFKIYGQEHVISDDFTIGTKYIDDNDFRRLSNYELFPGDIVITMMGTTGKCKVVPDCIERGIMDSHLIRVRIKSIEGIPTYISFLINDAPYIFSQIKITSKRLNHGRFEFIDCEIFTSFIASGTGAAFNS